MNAGPVYDPGPVPPDVVELRVVGCLIEKQRTTPDAYPLSVNALRTACNQATNRDPVVQFDDEAVLGAIERLGRRGWVRFASGQGSRARKYRHVLDQALLLDGAEIALLCVLMLRGAQTPGELKQRTERLHPFEELIAVDATLDRLVERALVARLGRRPGQKEQRHVQLLSGEPADVPSPALSPASGEVEAPPSASRGEDRLERVEREVELLRADLARLREALGE